MANRREKLDRTLGKLVNRAIAVLIAVIMIPISYFVFTADDFVLLSAGGMMSAAISVTFCALAIFLWHRNESFSEFIDRQDI